MVKRKSPVARRRSPRKSRSPRRSPRKHSPRRSPRKHSPRRSPRKHSPRRHSPRRSKSPKLTTAKLMKRIAEARLMLQKMIKANSSDLRHTAKKRSNIKNALEWKQWRKNPGGSDLQLIGRDPKGKFQYFDAKRREYSASPKRKSPRRSPRKSRKSPRRSPRRSPLKSYKRSRKSPKAIRR